jgi:hypothetical protein
MRPTEVMQPDARYVCLNTTLSTMNATWTTLRKSDNGKATVPGILDPISDPGLLQNSSCSLQDICGMSGFAYTLVPDQSFRFFTPLFVHAGVLHYLIDACLLWFVAKDLERVMNPIRFAGKNNNNSNTYFFFFFAHCVLSQRYIFYQVSLETHLGPSLLCLLIVSDNIHLTD